MTTQNENQTNSPISWYWEQTIDNQRGGYSLTLKTKGGFALRMHYKQIPYDPRKIAAYQFTSIGEAIRALPELGFDE